MPLSRRRILPLAAMVTVAALAVPGVAAADHGYDRSGALLRSGLVGSTPAPAGPALFGVTPGTSPWVIGAGRVRADRDGTLEIRIRRLVIPTPPANGTNPVPRLSASLVCNGSIADTTAPVPFDTAGNARIRERLDLPDTCLAPAVLVHPNTVTSVYIAATG